MSRCETLHTKKTSVLCKMASAYRCLRCGYETDRSVCYANHLNRRRPCIDVLRGHTTLDQLRDALEQRLRERKQCPRCGVTYTSRRVKSYHIRHCPAAALSTWMPPPVSDGAQTAPTTPHPPSRPFGEEDTEYLRRGPDALQNALDVLAEHDGVAALCRWAVARYFHAHHPENHTLRLTDDARWALTWNGSAWEQEDASLLLDQVVMGVSEDLCHVLRRDLTRSPAAVRKLRCALNEFMQSSVAVALLMDFGTICNEGHGKYTCARGGRRMSDAERCVLEAERQAYHATIAQSLRQAQAQVQAQTQAGNT